MADKITIITIESITNSIEDILDDADLTQLTAKKVRRQLEEKYGVDLLSRKDEIDEVLMRLLNEKQNQSSAESSSDEESEANSEEDKAKAKKRKIPPIKKKTPIKKSKKEVDSGSLSSDSDSDNKDKKLAKSLSEDGSRLRKRITKVKRKPKEKKPGDENKPKRKTGYIAEMILSPELAEVMGAEKMARNEVVKKMWQIIKERELQDPKDKRFTICDEQIQKVIGKKRFQTFGMMKHLNRHLSEDPERIEARRKKEEAKEGEEGKGGGGGGGYIAELNLSDELAELMGKKKMARKDVVKRMWEIIRERNLQDPDNRQFTLCDEQLLTVIGEKRFQTFGMMKYLTKHMTK